MTTRYLFPPPNNEAEFIGNYLYWENGFSDEDIERIISLGESRKPLQATVGGNQNNARIVPEIRITTVSWIDLQDDSVWLFNKIAGIVRDLNQIYYKFDLRGFCEDFQYTVYNGNESGHYEWHLDSKPEGFVRKLTFVLQLSDPEEYEGGELQLMTSVNPVTIEKRKGFAILFPSYTLHRVTPVTKGFRKTLVVWVTGPTFK